jgi:peptidoglycan-N-acetylglucosamine deacetylase
MATHKTAINSAKEEKNDPYWQAAQREVYKTPENLLAQDAAERHRNTPLPKLIRGSHRLKSLLLTFDDGPHPRSTPELLKILEEEKVPATFFVIGKMAEKHPELVKAIAKGGHTVANHSFSHVTLTKFPRDDIRTEYRANNDLVEKIIGKKMEFCRPPGGDYDADVIRAAEDEGLTTVLWTDDPGDFANPGDQVVLERTLKRLSNGGILLMHDGSPNTIDVIKVIINEARRRGFTFVSPETMVAELGDLRKAPVSSRRP